MIDAQTTLTAATVAAERTFSRNLQAVGQRQPLLAAAVAEVGVEVEWVLARDGSLTARSADGWVSECSIPRRTAEAVLRKMELGAVVTCFLSPTHAAQLRVTLDRLGAAQALIAVVPDVADVRLMLGCEAFVDEIEAGRLWFAWGEDWAVRLRDLLVGNDGLPVPGQFVRTAMVEDDRMQGMIARAQEVLSREMTRRAEAVREVFKTGVADSNLICAVAPGGFRLWDDAGAVIADMSRAGGWRVVDPDQPCQASPVALARAAADCGAVVAANLGRSDLSELLPKATRVITWLTGPRVPRFDPKAEADALVVADERWRPLAISAGWPADRVTVAGWPARGAAGAGAGLGVIADTVPIVRPAFDLSSHNVLWDTIALELANDPFAAGQDVAAYLVQLLRRAGIADGSVDARTFIERLILPAYQQGLVRRLIDAGAPVRLFGRGWGEIAEFAPAHQGEVSNPDALRRAVASCAALAHVWPEAWAHPIDAAGRPVLRLTFRGAEAWLSDARRIVAGPLQAHRVNAPPALSAALVMGLLRQ